MTGTGWARTDADGKPVYGRGQVEQLDHVAAYWRGKHAADRAQREEAMRVRGEKVQAYNRLRRAEKARDAAMLALLKDDTRGKR